MDGLPRSTKVKKYTYKNEDRVFVSTPSVTGWATVRGVAAEFPVVGMMYIVQMEQALPTTEYPFSSIVVPESSLSL